MATSTYSTNTDREYLVARTPEETQTIIDTLGGSALFFVPNYPLEKFRKSSFTGRIEVVDGAKELLKVIQTPRDRPLDTVWVAERQDVGKNMTIDPDHYFKFDEQGNVHFVTRRRRKTL